MSKTTVLLLASVLFLVPFAGAQSDEATFSLSGAMAQDREGDDLDRLHALAEDHDADLRIMESFPEQFVFSGLDKESCEDLRDDLEGRDGIARLGECHAPDARDEETDEDSDVSVSSHQEPAGNASDGGDHEEKDEDDERDEDSEDDGHEAKDDEHEEHDGLDDGRSRALDASGFDGQWVAFALDNGTLHNLTVDGVLVATEIAYDGGLPVPRADGARVVFRLDDGKLVVSDSRTGHISFESDARDELHVSFPDGSSLDHSRGKGLSVTGPGFVGFLDGDSLDVDGATASTHRELRFFVTEGQQRAREVHEEHEREHDDDVDDAIEDRRVGGEVRIDRDGSDVLVYDDVNITVDAGDGSGPLTVVFDAELDSGRTFVLDLDPALLNGTSLELRYYDIQDDGNQTEVVFRMADSLADILDASDDGGQPEYWVVEDANGVQVMVSVPHWSTHAITIESVGAFVSQPSVLIGAVSGLVGVGVAALVMLVPRRPDEL